MSVIRRATSENLPACVRIVCNWQRNTPYVPDGLTKYVWLPMTQEAFDAREIWVVENRGEGHLSGDPAEPEMHPEELGACV